MGHQRIPHYPFIIFFIGLFIFDCAGSSLLLAFASCDKQRPLSSCCGQASQCSGFSCCGAWAELPDMWDLPRPGMDPVSPALASGFIATEPQRSPSITFKSVSL